RAWSEDDYAAALQRLESRGLVKDGAFTSAGRELREQVETHTDGQMRGAIDAIGDGYSRLIDQLSAWSAAVRTLKG
ncbi:MAG: helix-turn-helix domain-containing protein, partial [Ilumatobacteraceae bacterium]